MTMKRIHINQAVIRKNHKTERNDAVSTGNSSKWKQYGREGRIPGPSILVCAGPGSTRKPFSLGARVRIRTACEVPIIVGQEDGWS